MNKIKSIFAILLIITCCTACNGSINRDIRHAGFSMGGTFTCSDFFPKDKEDTSYKKIKYFTNTHLIDTNGEIYELSVSQPYQNGENCKKAKTDLKEKAIFDDKIIKATDSKYYYLVDQNNFLNYEEIPATDNSYYLYDLLLSGEDVVKVQTADSSSGLYYVLKDDGNVYAYTVTKENYNAPSVVSSVSIVFDKSTYDSNITDFNYAGNSLNTFIRTEESVYRMKIVNSKKCLKYADVACKYTMKKDDIFNEYKDTIIMYNGSMLITNYKQVFSVSE